MAEDTVIINTVRVKLEKSDTDSFEVYVERYSRGRRVSQARALANAIIYQIVQKDSILYVPSGISIPPDSKFRGQRVRVVVKVPKGKNVVMDKKLNNRYNWSYDEDDDWNDWGKRRHRNKGSVEIKMNDDGTQDDINEEKNTPDTEHKGKGKDSIENNYRYKGRKQESTTPVEDSGSHSGATAGAGTMSWDGVDMICYSLYNMIK
jgi:phage shock protein C